MEEARARGNEIIDQHQKALEGVFKTHKQEAVMQADTRIKTETASARQQLNTVTSKGQLKLRIQLSRVHNDSLIDSYLRRLRHQVADNILCL